MLATNSMTIRQTSRDLSLSRPAGVLTKSLEACSIAVTPWSH